MEKRIRIRLFTLMRFRIPAFHINADPDPALHFDADPDPQYWYTIKICVSVVQYAMFFYGTYETGFVKKTEVRSWITFLC